MARRRADQTLLLLILPSQETLCIDRGDRNPAMREASYDGTNIIREKAAQCPS
jgi:hypothetical protein